MQALKNIKIDKVVVWDNGGNGKDNSTGNFIKGFMNSVPGYEEIYKMAGVDMPSLLQGKETSKENKSKKISVTKVLEE